MGLATQTGDVQQQRAESYPICPDTVRLPSLRYKRALDLVVGTVLIVLSAPLAILVAILVKITSPGPVLFRQERIGLNGRPLVMHKFRTMYVGAEPTHHRDYFEQYRQGVPAPDQKRPIFKMRSDPRIVPLGGLLRRLGLDELPQLFNVIRGDMSLVGPRPPLAYEVERYSERDRLRLSVKPGITGLWQVKGRDIVDFATMVDLDVEYIRRQSLGLDLLILLTTIPTLMWSFLKD